MQFTTGLDTKAIQRVKPERNPAESIGGDLPDRVELAFMYKYLKDQFKPTVYWSNEADGTEWAWFQGFSYGYQGNDSKDGKLRARAVRRLSVI